MEIINAKNIGVKFKLSRNRSASLRRRLAESFSKENRQQEKYFWALKDVSFSVNKGDILGVVGSNGSGKSTLLRTIGGIYAPDEGSLKVNGTVSTLLSLGTGFKQELNGLDNIFLNGVTMGFTKNEVNEQLDNIINFAELGNFINEPVKNYSSGMKARLGFAISIHLMRDIMLIDEILGVGDFKFKEKSQGKMLELIQDGRTIVIVSHNLDTITKYCTKAIWINKGVLQGSGDPEEVVSEYLKT